MTKKEVTREDIKQMFNDINYLELRRKMLIDKFNYLDSYTGVQSVSADRVIASGEGKSYGDRIDQKDEVKEQINYYTRKINEFIKSLDVLDQEERDILYLWYSTNKKVRPLAEVAAKQMNMSRRNLFRVINCAIDKLYNFHNR